MSIFRALVLFSITAIPFHSALVVADELSEADQVQAMQFGLMLGGAATQYDGCAKRGLAPILKPSAEDEAKSFFKASEEHTHSKESSVYVLKGWDLAKQKIQEQDSEYWKNQCVEITQQWEKYRQIIKQG
ncbi:MAG TPA: hypothetical protein VLC91_00830 [Spongiibacteraceae bacterium]|nr:hypothetical protein [Spongiibacteraceae bacterium]